MRNAFYHTLDDGDTRKPGDAAVFYRVVVQIATLMFWTPCCAIDLWLLAARGASSEAGFVFNLLFRQAIVFLALWFAAAFAQGLMRGNRAAPGPDVRQRRRLRAYLDSGANGYVAPTRGNRGQ